MRLPRLGLTPELRLQFAAAWGPVYTGETLLRLLSRLDGAVCVGDYVSSICCRVLEGKRLVVVVDGATRREVVAPLECDADCIVEVSNPRGGLSLEAYQAACKSLEEPCGRRILVRVSGEEDMMALAFIDCSDLPVIYGLPEVGSVVVKPGPIARVMAGSSLILMKRELAPG